MYCAPILEWRKEVVFVCSVWVGNQEKSYFVQPQYDSVVCSFTTWLTSIPTA